MKSKKKQIAELKAENERLKKLVEAGYDNWEKDFGFLRSVIDKKRESTRLFNIEVYGSQMEKTMIKDSEVDAIIKDIVEETFTSLSNDYISFLVTKYFETVNELIKYITEEFSLPLKTAAILENNKIINRMVNTKKITDLGKKSAK